MPSPAPAQLLSTAEAITILVAVGCWDTSLAQALAAEVRERRLAHLLWEHQTGKQWRDKEAEEYKLARAARTVMDDLAGQVYREVMSQPNGRWSVTAYLSQTNLCGCCMNVKESVAACRANCGRQLCALCRTALGICTNRGICRQQHSSRWRVGVKVVDKGCALYKQWEAAAADADRYTDLTGWGHRLAARGNKARR